MKIYLFNVSKYNDDTEELLIISATIALINSTLRRYVPKKKKKAKLNSEGNVVNNHPTYGQAEEQAA